MNMLSKIEPDASNNGQQLALPPNLGDMCAGRDKAIALWIDTYKTLHENAAAAGAASIGGNIGLSVGYGNHNSESEKITKALLSASASHYTEQDTHKRIEVTALAAFTRRVTRETDRRCWSHLLEKLGFDQLLDRQAREEFQDSLRNNPPEFTEANCAATFSTIWGDRRTMYLRGIANVFMKMDRRFRSHDTFAIGNRLVIERAMRSDSWGGWESYNRRDTLHDVERIFRELDECHALSPDDKEGIVYQVKQAHRSGGLPQLVQGDYFRVRVFKNGNLHLWFERKDLLAEVNKLLLEYYKPLEGDAGEGPSYEPGPDYHKTPAKYFGEFFTSEDVAERVIEMAYIREGDLVLEPSAGSGVLAKAARAKGGKVTCIEIQDGLAFELATKHGFPETYTGDFLLREPKNFPEFDVIVMNPPFDRGRDCDHVRHAFQFLKPGGRLVAIMSARAEFAEDARHKALHDLIAAQRGRYDNAGREWSDLPEKSFAHAGTNVNTVILSFKKKA
jgi:predicted RNA methylase